MLNPAFLSYASATAIFALLTVLLLTSAERRPIGLTLAAAVAITALWSGFLAVESDRLFSVDGRLAPWFAVEALRYGAWIGFVVLLLYGDTERLRVRPRAYPWLVLWALVLAAGMVVATATVEGEGQDAQRVLLITGILVLSATSLVLLEQLYRNTRPEDVWALKHLVFALAGVFLLDLFVFADALLFREPDPTFWSVRGACNALAAPLIALSASRTARWATPIFVSRQVVFHSTGMIALGAILLTLAVGGYYIREHGGTWANFAFLLVAFGALLATLSLLSSRTLRAHAKVFLEKHFFHNKYDYRREWLAFTETLSAPREDGGDPGHVIEAAARILACKSGLLWQEDDEGGLRCTGAWNREPPSLELPADDRLLGLMAETGWVVDLRELARSPQRYGGIAPPAWLEQMPDAWVLAPLVAGRRLQGLLVLADPLIVRELNWEDHDLLKTVCRAIVTQLELRSTSLELAEARQFDTFNRMSAFVVHDLKNIIAQLELVIANAARHKGNPAFVEDAFATVANAVSRGRRLLTHLAKAAPLAGEQERFRLDAAVRSACERRSGFAPAPALHVAPGEYLLLGDAGRAETVIEHLVQNAQEATPAQGSVEVRLSSAEDSALLEITDDGSGMEPEFVRERLFKPFFTTKGSAGLGLGAFEAREYVASLGGRLRVHSRPGAGTRIAIEIPLATPGPDHASTLASGGAAG